MKKCLFSFLVLSAVPAFAKTYTFSGVGADNSSCQIAIRSVNSVIESIDGSGYGREWSVDLFDKCDGFRCVREEILNLNSSVGGNDLTDPKVVSTYGFTLTGSLDGSFLISGQREGTDSTQKLTIQRTTPDSIEFKEETTTGIVLNIIPVHRKTVTCKNVQTTVSSDE